MNRNQIKFLWIAVLLFSTLACRAATRLIIPDTPTPPPTSTFTPVPSPTPTATATPTQVVEASCPQLLSDIMDAASDYRGSNKKADKQRFLVMYRVNGDRISNPIYESVPTNLKDEQQDRTRHEALWNYFAAIIPAEQRNFVSGFSIFTDGKGHILAAVTQDYRDPKQWDLDMDIADSSDSYNLTFTLIHEFGHLLTLNAKQVTPSRPIFNHPDDPRIVQQEVDACSQYFPGEGCSTPSSYINVFYDRFWTRIYEEWKQIDEKKEQDEDKYYRLLDKFYDKYKDRFVTDYAATSPEEDMAETWAFFILAPKPQGGSIADQKVLFYYRYPELVDLRGQILNRLCMEFPQ
jgi:hypothetical protein